MVNSATGTFWGGASNCSLVRSGLTAYTFAATIQMPTTELDGWAIGFGIGSPFSGGNAQFSFGRQSTMGGQMVITSRQSGSGNNVITNVTTAHFTIIMRRDSGGTGRYSYNGGALTAITLPAIAARTDYTMQAGGMGMLAAECAIWGRALMDDEMAAYGKGRRPIKMPNGLLGYWPFVRDGNSRLGGENVNTTNASGTVTTHLPRIFP